MALLRRMAVCGVLSEHFCQERGVGRDFRWMSILHIDGIDGDTVNRAPCGTSGIAAEASSNGPNIAVSKVANLPMRLMSS